MINHTPARISVQEIHDTYTALLARPCETTSELEQYMLDIDQRESRVGETYARSYIHQSCDTTDTAKKELYMYYVQDVMPILSEYDDQINRKLMDTGLLQTLPSIYTNIVRKITTNIALFRAENIPLSTKDEEL
jgi:oligoendopeptidase F